MGIRDWLFNANSRAEPPALVEDKILDAAIRGYLPDSEVMTGEKAMDIPVVNACVSFISEIVASLPVKMYRKLEDNTEEVVNDYRLKLLNSETGDLLDAHQMKSAMIRDYLIHGNGYAVVNRVGTKIKSLNFVEQTHVSYIAPTDPVFKRTTFHVHGVKYQEYQLMRILRHSNDGISGKGIIEDSSQVLNIMSAALEYERKQLATGCRKGFLKASKHVTQEAINTLKAAWKKMFSSKEESMMFLNDGIEFQDAALTAVESQLNQNKTANSADICKIFGLPPSILDGTATEITIKNATATAIKPAVEALQTAFNRFLLLEAEKDSFEFVIDLDAIDTTSLLVRLQSYEIAVRNGMMTIDEVRYEEGLKPLGLDFIKLGLDNVIYDPSNKQMYTPNTKEWASLSDTAIDASDSDEKS